MSPNLEVAQATGPRSGHPATLVSSPPASRDRDRVRDAAILLVALVCAGSAGIHAGLVPAHLDESVPLGILFAAAAVLLGLAALVISDRDRSGREVALVAGILATTVTAYLMSRTTGLPGLIRDAEPVDGLGVFTTLSELIGLGACVLLILRRERR